MSTWLAVPVWLLMGRLYRLLPRGRVPYKAKKLVESLKSWILGNRRNGHDIGHGAPSKERHGQR